MINRIQLTNFFSFHDEAIDLNHGVNILVGINGSGKSNLIKAIRLLKIGVEGNSDQSALHDLVVNKWGGFDNIYCKSLQEKDYPNSLRLAFTLDKKVLNRYADRLMSFRHNITYRINLIKKPSSDNYYVSESIATDSGFEYLNVINGEGKVSERQEQSGVVGIKYEGNSQELGLASISEFDKDRFLPLVVIKRAIKDIEVYDYFDTSRDSPLRRAMSATSSARRLLPDGRNLPQVINWIKIHNKPQFQALKDMLNEANPHFTGIDFNMLGSGFFELMLDESALGSSIHITHVSDGTLRYLCLLAILLHPDRGSMVCIDEPEIGLHPDMIQSITRAISESSDDSSLIMATHSAEILNAFNVGDIRVFEKNDQNCTSVLKYQEADFEGWYETYRPGTMWRQGDLGGNRW